MRTADRADGEALRLPRPPGALRRLLLAHPRIMDVVVVLVVLLLNWIQVDEVGLAGPPIEVLGGPWWAPAVLLTALALLLRRTRPLVPLAVLAAAALLVLVDDRGPLYAPLAAMVYALAVYRSVRMSAAAAGALLVLDIGLSLVAGGLSRAPTFAVVFAVVALLLGANIGGRRRYLAAVLDRAAQLAVERDQRARLAVADERARIARELHDVVAHGLSVIVRLSDGADAVAESDPQRSRDAVRQIGRVGRGSLRDMRRLLGVLSEDEQTPDLAPQPSLADVDALVETYRSAGLPVTVERSGSADLDPATQLVVHRAVQEGLTNALRYARSPGTVVVRLALGDPVEVEVVDDGAATDTQPSVGSGRGLLGLRERAALYGGEVTAGPRAELGGRGWRTRVRLPLDTTAEAGR